ncbi:MAG TPA: hypothetical protein VE153_18960 [Myxococcus sp.]|nr:hypothetical protein [Myxococcus sp.]
MQTAKHENLITRGLVQPLDTVRFHNLAAAPLVRRLMAGADVLPQANQHIAVHEIRGASWAHRGCCAPHQHEVAEANLLLSWERLVFSILLGEETYAVEAPATIYIPPRLLHSANVLEGSGFFIAMLGSGDYNSTFAGPSASQPPARPPR